MNKILLGIFLGFTFGFIDVLIMIPMPEKDKQKKIEAMTGAFLERFMTGFVIANLDLGIHPIFTGLMMGAGFSIPTAVITRVYLPIIGVGILGGGILGYVTSILI